MLALMRPPIVVQSESWMAQVARNLTDAYVMSWSRVRRAGGTGGYDGVGDHPRGVHK